MNDKAAWKLQKKRDAGWREFEKLVARVERALAPKDAVVRSPDTLPDKVTGEFREVDASIRYKVGTTEILIILECRERKRVQDVLWIEQLASKQRDIGAAKCIAISASNFTNSAVRKATAAGIELRHVKRISDDAIQKWAPLRTCFYQYTLGKVSLSFFDETGSNNEKIDNQVNGELASKYYLEDKFVRFYGTDKVQSGHEFIDDLLGMCFSEMKDQERLKIPLNKEILLSFAGSLGTYVECSFGKVELIGAGLFATFHQFKDYSVEASDRFTYSDQKSDLVEGVEFRMTDTQGRTTLVSMHKDMLSQQTFLSAYGPDRWTSEQVSGAKTPEDQRRAHFSIKK